MNLLETIINYYYGEARHGFWAAVIGGFLVIGGLILWKWAAPLSLLKGVAVPMFLFGLLMGVGGAADKIYTSKITPGKIALYKKDSISFLTQEKEKTEKTHRGWRSIRIFWAILGLGGLALSLLIRKPFWIGAGLGTVGLAVFLSLFEFFSMRFNERYYHVIQSETEQKAGASIQAIPVETKSQQTYVEPQIIGQTHTNLGRDTPLPQITPFDSLKSLSAPAITAAIAKDPVIIDTLNNNLQIPTLVNEAEPVYFKGKKRKVLDYYNSDLIQTNGINARHCWFSKKYIKE